MSDRLTDEQVSNRQIARALGVAPATVDRDLASNEALGKEKANSINGGSVTGASNEAPAGLTGAQAARLVSRRETGDSVQ